MLIGGTLLEILDLYNSIFILLQREPKEKDKMLRLAFFWACLVIMQIFQLALKLVTLCFYFSWKML